MSVSPERLVIAAAAALAVFGASAFAPMGAEFLADPAAVVAAAATAAAEAADAHVVVLDERVHIRYEADGTDTVWDEEYTLPLTEQGRRALAKVELWVSRRYGDAEIQAVEIISADGVVRPVDFAATVKEATDNSSVAANIYDPLDRNLVASVPTLAVGEIRRVVTCRRCLHPRMAGAWSDRFQLEGEWPIRSTVITVDAPAALPLAAVHLASPPPHSRFREERTAAGDRLGYRFEIAEVPRYFPEARMPSASECLATLSLTTVSDWPAVSRWYADVCESHLAATNAAMAAVVAAAVAAAPTNRLEALRAIFKFVSQEVRYMGLTLEDTSPGYAPHDVALTFDNRYGVCRDKAALLTAMLRLGGFEAYPVLINVGARLDAEAATPFFNHAIVAVRGGHRDLAALPDAGGWVLLDPTNETTRDLCPAYLANRSFLVASPAGETLMLSPSPSALDNLLAVEGEGELLPDGSLTAVYRLAPTGMADNLLRRFLERRTPRERYDDFAAALAATAPGARIVALDFTPADLKDTETPLRLSVRIAVPAALGDEGDTLALQLPLVTAAVNPVDSAFSGALSLKTRRFPLKFSVPLAVSERCRLRLGEWCGEAVALPSALALGDDALGYRLSRTVALSDGELTLAQEEALTRLEIPTNAYAAVRQARRTAQLKRRERCAFAPRRSALSDLDVRTRTRTVRCRSAREADRSEADERVILTDRGRRLAAERKLVFNPALTGLRVTVAEVETAEGERLAASDHAVNDLDSDAASVAPRYANGKTRVVNLPAQRIGAKSRFAYTAEALRPRWSGVIEDFVFRSVNPLGVATFALERPDSVAAGVRLVNAATAHIEERQVSVSNGWTRQEFAVRDPMPLAIEPATPPELLTEPMVLVRTLTPAAALAPLAERLAELRAEGAEAAAERARTLADTAAGEALVAALRLTLQRSVRVAATDDLYSLPLEGAAFAPDRALADGYASALDYLNLLRAMLEATGFEVESFLTLPPGPADRLGGEFAARHGLYDEFTEPALVVRWSEGWWPWRERRELIIDARQNEYTPLGASRLAGGVAFSLDRLEFAALPAAADGFEPRSVESRTLVLAGDRSAVITTAAELYGPEVGDFRRRFTEMRPEIRRRLTAELAAAIILGAESPEPIATDVEGYPARSSFTAGAAEYAEVQDGVWTVEVESAAEREAAVDDFLPDLGSLQRTRPILLAHHAPVVTEFDVTLPRSARMPSVLPPPLELCLPGEREAYFTAETAVTEDAEGRWHVRLTRRWEIPASKILPPEAAALLSLWRERLLRPENSRVRFRLTDSSAKEREQ